jgi:predicted phage tail protein
MTLATVITTGVSVTGTTAIVGGNITSDGGGNIIARGICWGATFNPTVSDNVTNEGNGTGTFSSTITGLSSGETYHARAYATNSAGVQYGDDVTFVSTGGAPTATTEYPSTIGSTYVTLNASVDPNYISTVVTFEYGTTTSYGQSATAENSPLTGAGSRNAWVNIPSGLIPATNYHFRVKAVNSSGTVYGEDNTFTTLGGAPTATTENASSIGSTYVTLNASVDPNYISTVVTFEYGTTTSYGQSVTAENSPLTGAGSRNAWVNIPSGLIPATNYHFRVKAVNSSGTDYGEDNTFTTLGGAPTATTENPSTIGSTYVTLNASVDPNYISTVVTFEYGTTTSYGQTVTAGNSPLTGAGSRNAWVNITSGLTPATNYHFRVKAVNSSGTVYGDDKTFKTSGGK